MTKFSVLDLCPVPEGETVRQAMDNSLCLAQVAEQCGYHRYWFAEHHNMPGVASAATSLVISHIAAATNSIRVGAGGIMLPNHSPLQIAEQFGTLAALYPGRIDLGVGRAPGTDPSTAYALRRNLNASDAQFPQDVVELIDYFREAQPGQRVVAVPGAGQQVPIWVLGSSLFGAQLAAALGLPYAFASHFAPGDLLDAINLYRRSFKPSEWLDAPYVMAGYNIVAADSDEHAEYLFSSQLQNKLNLRLGRPGKLPKPVEGFVHGLSAQERAIVSSTWECAAIGSVGRVAQRVSDFIAKTEVDELIVLGQIHDHQARLTSLKLAAHVLSTFADEGPATPVVSS